MPRSSASASRSSRRRRPAARWADHPAGRRDVPSPGFSMRTEAVIYLFQILNGLGLGVIYFLLAVGLSIIFGLLQFVNFAHGAFYMLGAYLAYDMTRRGVSFWLAMPAAALFV